MTHYRREDLSFALGLTAPQVSAAVRSADLDEQLRSDALDFTVFGIDRLWTRPAGDGTAVDPFVAAVAVSNRAGPLRVLGTGSPATDHPYNLSRRAASVDHFLAGNGGLVLAESDGYRGVPSTRPPPAPLTPSLISTPGVATTADAALAMVRLWQSWADDALVADPATRSFADASKIRRVDHRGLFSIDGPSTLPASPQGTPVLGWYVRSREEVAAAAAVTDLLLFATGGRAGRRARGLIRTWALAPIRSYLELRLDATARITDHSAVRRPAGFDGLLLTFPSASLTEIAAALRTLPAGPAGRLSAPRTLRERLGLPWRADLLQDAAPAFSATDHTPAGPR